MKQLYRIPGKICCLLGLFLGFSLSVRATHIVGGELELRRMTGASNFTHQINLNLYFDELNGDAGAEDPSITVYIFRKSDNALMGAVELPQSESRIIDYTKPECAIPSLSTRLIRYSRDVNFNLNAFNDPAGYYMVWERCCRNNTINNIQNPGGAGSTFYLEFPPMRNPNGSELVNSSPVFLPMKGDYICLNQPFSLNFGATDPDGDSLVYRLVTPYNGYSSTTRISPPATPSSVYPEVRWSNGISLSSVIPGPAPLQVDSRSGRLTVTAGRVGLYVFCVQVEEYRRRPGAAPLRLGVVRRDFQLKVIDCQLNNPPTLLMRPAGRADFYQEGTVLSLQAGQANCVDLLITDKDVNQRITLTTLGTSTAGVSFSPGQVLIRTPNDTVRSRVCFDPCLASPDGRPITVALIASDEGCPQGARDTLLVRLLLAPDPNQGPDITTNLPGNRATVRTGDTLRFNVTGTDPNQDSITVEAVGRGFNLLQAGMRFTRASGKGSVRQPFQWIPGCDQLTKEYIVDFIVTEKWCSTVRKDTVTVRLQAEPQPNRPPTVRTSLPNPTVELTVSLRDSIPGSVQFDVTGEDPDPGPIQLLAQGVDFDWKEAGMQFTEKTGPSALTSPFSWRPTCAVLNGKPEATFRLDLISRDNSCPGGSDTTRVTFIVRDLPVDYAINIPNVLTPNGDGKNDYFTVPNLPEDNCVERFMKVEVINRWGKAVYSSTDRNFRWDGDDLPAGQYYYLIQYTGRSYKGVVTILR